jgi:predicted metal-dependent hydrolase
MAEIQVGKLAIPYVVRRSDLASRKSIIVTPNNVEVVAPTASADVDICEFVQQKRHWVFNKLTEMNERLAYIERHTYNRLQSGAKIRFRGRYAKVLLTRGDVMDFDIQFNNGFRITAPAHLSDEDMGAMLSIRMVTWFKNYLKREAAEVVKGFEAKLGLKSQGIKIIHSDTLWGSLTKGGVIKLNWHLVEAPKAVLEYVIVHEICHLVHRNHTDAFWALIAQQMPDYSVRKKWLESLMPSFKL